VNFTRIPIGSPIFRNILLIFVFFVFCSPPLLLAEKEANLDHLRGYRFEFLIFKAERSEKTYLEVFAKVPTHKLFYTMTDEGYQANYTISVNLYDHMGLFVDSKIYKRTVDLQIGDRDQPLTLTSEIVKFHFFLSSGKHKVVVYVTDLENLETFAFSKIIDIPDYSAPGLHLSDIQISSSMKYTTKESSFVKNNWEFSPNVSNLFGKELKTLYIYAESYNLTLPSAESFLGLKSVFTIKKSDGEVVKSIEKESPKFVGTNVLAAQIPISELSAGQYELTLNITDKDTGKSVEKSANFIVVDPVLISSSKTKPKRSP